MEILYRTTIYCEFSNPYSLAILSDQTMVPNTAVYATASPMLRII